MDKTIYVSKRHCGLDLTKYFCSFMIIYIHMPYRGKLFFEPLTRFAVPVFFMITGYFYSSIKRNRREYQQLGKSAMLFLSSNLLYLIWNMVDRTLSGRSILNYLYAFWNPKVWIKLLCFNEPFLSEHLWYLSAIVYVLVIILAFDKYSNREKLYKFIPGLLLINIVLGNYSAVLLGESLPLVLSRNFLFCGLPFFLLGDYICKNHSRLTQGQLVVMAVFSVFLTIAENRFLRSTEVPFNADCFIATPFLAYSLFMLALGNNNISHIPLLDKLARLGKTASTTIYIVHPIAIAIMSKIIPLVSRSVPAVNAIWYYTAPLIILVLCTFFACLMNTLQRIFKQSA